MSSTETESTLLIIKECFCYKIPPRTSAGGHKAADWPDENLIWRGRLVIMERGDLAVIKLITPDTGETFAECPVYDGSVDTVLDSSRYFVLKVEDKLNKRHAFIGIGFAERSEAFDFNAALQDHDRRRIDAAQSAKRRAEAGPAPNYSIPTGQTITVHLPGSSSSAAPQQPRATSASTGPISLTGLVPPPPSAGGRTKHRVTGAAASQQPQQQQQQPSPTMWGDFQGPI